MAKIRDRDINRSKPIDFNVLCRLAQQNPAEFERRRTEILEQFIASAPANHRDGLLRTQWAVDQTRKRTNAPYQLIHNLWQKINSKTGAACGGKWVQELSRLLGLPNEPSRQSLNNKKQHARREK
ncbi:MAG: DUF3135 domain-containing protein [Thiohalomonadaceae bacterium]